VTSYSDGGAGVVDAAGGGRRRPTIGLRTAYGLTSIALAGLYAVLPEVGRTVVLAAVVAGAAGCIAFGRRAVRPDRRLPWTMLLGALAAFVVANLVQLLPSEHAGTAYWLIDTAGNLLVLGAALTLIIGRGPRDLGGIVDAAVIAFAAGSVLWTLLPHRIGPDASPAAQLDLFVVVFAFTGVLGALLRIAGTAAERNRALGWLLTAIGVAIVENVLRAVAGDARALLIFANTLALVAITAAGLFGLHPAAPYLMRRQTTTTPERLSAGRLAFLAAAVAAVPIVAGARELVEGDMGGALLAVQGLFVAALVMLRIGVLSSERERAEQALEHQAAHDPLTQLINRREFIARLHGVLGRGLRCAVFFCDLDDFKSINDMYGHDAGDQLLIEVARRFTGCVHPPHVVSRFGGDEFVILLIDISSEQAQAVRECLTTALDRPFAPAGNAPVGVSIGVARSDENHDPEQLLRSADHAMYMEKVARGRPGRGSFDGDSRDGGTGPR
jgi:diguanylate cyclase (GGDEF)-like protein